MTAWVEGRVAGRRRWSDSLHSLLVHAPVVTFIAGQFARLAWRQAAAAAIARLTAVRRVLQSSASIAKRTWSRQRPEIFT